MIDSEKRHEGEEKIYSVLIIECKCQLWFWLTVLSSGPWVSRLLFHPFHCSCLLDVMAGRNLLPSQLCTCLRFLHSYTISVRKNWKQMRACSWVIEAVYATSRNDHRSHVCTVAINLLQLGVWEHLKRRRNGLSPPYHQLQRILLGTPKWPICLPLPLVLNLGENKGKWSVRRTGQNWSYSWENWNTSVARCPSSLCNNNNKKLQVTPITFEMKFKEILVFNVFLNFLQSSCILTSTLLWCHAKHSLEEPCIRLASPCLGCGGWTVLYFRMSICNLLSKASEIPKPESLLSEWNSLTEHSKLITFKEVWTSFPMTTWQLGKGENHC